MEKSLVKGGFKGGLKGNLRALVVMAMLIALSVVFGKFLQIPVGVNIRISFENLPILLAGMLFGPFGGAAVGIASDLLGCLAMGYSIVPFITVAAGVNGLLAGILSRVIRGRTYPRILLITMGTHAVGSMLLKSLALHWAFAAPWVVLVWRIPTYLCIGLAEAYILFVLYRKKVVAS